MNERSIWTVIRFNKLINTAHTLDWMPMCQTPSFNDLIQFMSIQGRILMQDCFLLQLLAHHDLQHYVIFTQTINLWLAAPAVGLYGLNILYLDMRHQPNMDHATHWNSICHWKWCTRCKLGTERLLRIAVAVIFQKALNQSTLTELK